jgi:hypothetical protein
MKKTAPILIVIFAIIIAIAFSLKQKNNRVIDWEETFDERSTNPYGLSVLYKELPNLFKDKTIRTVYHTPSSYLFANSEDNYGDHIAKGSYIIIGNSDYLYNASITQLLSFAENGNAVFISDYGYLEKITDTLELDIDYKANKKDSISTYSFKDKTLQSKNTTIDKNDGDYYFSSFDSTYINILGYTKSHEKHANFIDIPYGEGNIYLHLEPKVFTNYNILKGDRYKYVEGVLSYLPDDDVYFDSYTKFSSSYNSYNNGDVEEDSNLGWFLEQPAFKWAWYLALLLLLIFIIFNAKRRQRIIRIIKPLQNTTVAFVKTISNLYFETQDHKNLIDKKITYFLAKIRTDYNMDTAILDDEFITRLASKAGKKEDEIKTTIEYIKWLRTKNVFYEDNLITLNKYIEAFYSK